jgi:hypothetical protein
MSHLSEEQFVMKHFGDSLDGNSEQHLAGCGQCRAELEKLAAMLAQVKPRAVPELPEYYEQQVWLRLRDRLPAKSGLAWWPKLAAAGVVALLVVAAFLAGTRWRSAHQSDLAGNKPNTDRIVLVAVGNHLERSQMLLVEIMGADAKQPVELSSEQAQARDLLDSNRLLRVSAKRAGDPAIDSTLDQLERVLAELANSPDGMTPQDLQRLQSTIEQQGLLFKVRVVGNKVRQTRRQDAESTARKGNQTL